VLLAESMPAVLDAPIDAPTPLGDGCEFRDQLSSVQESVGFAAVVLTSGEFEPRRGDDGKSESRVVFVRPMDGPLLLLLLFVLPSQAVAQLSGTEVERSVEGDDEADGCAQFAEVLELGCPPRYESVVNDGPLSTGVVLNGVKLLLAVVGSWGSNRGGAAIVEPMLVQPLLGWGAGGFANTLRSTGVTGVDEFQFEAGGGASVPVLVGHGGGARLPLLVELAVGAAACDVANGLFDCAG
jgi:hypothetical protein